MQLLSPPKPSAISGRLRVDKAPTMTAGTGGSIFTAATYAPQGGSLLMAPAANLGMPGDDQLQSPEVHDSADHHRPGYDFGDRAEQHDHRERRHGNGSHGQHRDL